MEEGVCWSENVNQNWILERHIMRRTEDSECRHEL